MKTVLASFIFFTRLPFWRITNVDARYFSHVVDYWPLVGWLTGGITAGTLYLSSLVFPLHIAVLTAFLVRILITGALHEDGLADFFDGFGGGTNRDRILSIMKDSHIGTYGVISLIFYYLLLTATVSCFPVPMVLAIIFCADTWSKFSASMVVFMLPYARTAVDAKNKTVYIKPGVINVLIAFAAGALPLVCIPPVYLLSAVTSYLTAICIIFFIKKKINGYTGDCCGAAFLICELMFFISTLIIYRLTCI